MKNCIDCQFSRFSRERPYGLVCMSPKADIAGRVVAWHRSMGFAAWINGACGKSGRFFEAKPVPFVPADNFLKPGSITLIVDGENAILARSPLRDTKGHFSGGPVVQPRGKGGRFVKKVAL